MMEDNRQQGFTLIELMVGATIGIILTLAILQLYMQTRLDHHAQQVIWQSFETGEFLLERIKIDFRQADNWGCSKVKVNQTRPAQQDYVDYQNSSILGTEGTADTVQLASIMAKPEQLIADMASQDDIIQVRTNNAFQQYQQVIIYDCIDADIFEITNANTGMNGILMHSSDGPMNPGNMTDILSKSYSSDAEVVPVQVIKYYLKPGENRIPTVYRDVNDETFELANYVSDFKILYGIDTNGDNSANQYMGAGSIHDWTKVVSARIHFLVYTENNITKTHQTFTFMGRNIVAKDYRYRQEYVTTVNIRNHRRHST